MSRLEKKCFIGAAACHGLLLVIVLFGAAFLPSNSPETLPQVIQVFDSKVTDRALNSGGNPNANPQPPAPQPPAEPPKPEPPPPPPPKQVKPEPVREEVKVPEPVKPKKSELAKDKIKPPTPQKDATESAKPKLSTQVVRRTNDIARLQREAQRQAEQKAEQKYRDDLARYNEQRNRAADAVNGIIRDTGSALGKTPVVEVQGPGGLAYANYGSLVGEVYKRAVYATHPQSDRDAEAVIKVLISRDGTVRNSQWTRRTGNSILDKAVDRAMSSVRSLPEFPPEAKDSERSFNITIAFEAKRDSA